MGMENNIKIHLKSNWNQNQPTKKKERSSLLCSTSYTHTIGQLPFNNLPENEE